MKDLGNVVKDWLSSSILHLLHHPATDEEKRVGIDDELAEPQIMLRKDIARMVRGINVSDGLTMRDFLQSKQASVFLVEMRAFGPEFICAKLASTALHTRNNLLLSQ